MQAQCHLTTLALALGRVASLLVERVPEVPTGGQGSARHLRGPCSSPDCSPRPLQGCGGSGLGKFPFRFLLLLGCGWLLLAAAGAPASLCTGDRGPLREDGTRQ
ncbi:Hypothetical predicted protein [Marmota monax]|uniref:Uncharacterized protein n=1 Tax=Marmota monax TaxID=9995 RepID=A0A5E4BRL2_MARMO|nr:Hypothetical predicted protein [Marmota monax]